MPSILSRTTMVRSSMKKSGMNLGGVSKDRVKKNISDDCNSYATLSTVSLHSSLSILSLNESEHLDRENNRNNLKRQRCSFDLSSMAPQLDNYPSRIITPSRSISNNQSWDQFIDVSNHYTKHCKYNSTVLFVPGTAEHRRMIAKRRLNRKNRQVNHSWWNKYISRSKNKTERRSESVKVTSFTSSIAFKWLDGAQHRAGINRWESLIIRISLKLNHNLIKITHLLKLDRFYKIQFVVSCHFLWV